MLDIELLIKSACLKMSVYTFIPSGIVFFISASSASISSVSEFVSTFGCLVTVSSTAGLSSFDATSFGNFSPIFTSATSRMSTIPFSSLLTTAKPMSSTFDVLISPFTIYSLPYSYIVPPPTFVLMFDAALSISLSDTP